MTAVAELCSLRGEVPWNIVTDSHCALALSRALTRTVSVLSVGFLHAREAFFGASKCKFCENLHLKTLCSRLEVYERESSVLPRRAPEASAAFREYTTWDSDVELEAMEGEPLGLTLSLPLLPEHVRTSSPVEFMHDYLYPSPETRDTITFRLEDVIYSGLL